MNSKEKSKYKDDEVVKLIGMKIREARLTREISEEKLAIECELDYSQTNPMELWKINFTISDLYKVARSLDVDPKESLVTP